MGVKCEISLHKPANGAYTPGCTVSGVIKYVLDEDTIFNNITIAMKGRCRLVIVERKYMRFTFVHTNKEDYYHHKSVTHSDESGKKALSKGSYEQQFNFKLPENVPSTLNLSKYRFTLEHDCTIEHFISIKFNRPEMFKINKKFKKEITVISEASPRLPIMPTFTTEEKELFQLFSSKKGTVNIKATTPTRIIKSGDKFEFEYEIMNNSNVEVKEVIVKLKEGYTLTSNIGQKFHLIKTIKDTDSKSGAVRSGEVKTMSVVIDVPSKRFSLDHSKCVTRDYWISIKAVLPVPHNSAILKIPIQINGVDQVEEAASTTGIESPPTYWEAMAEYVEKK